MGRQPYPRLFSSKAGGEEVERRDVGRWVTVNYTQDLM